MKSILHSFKNIWGMSVLCGILLTIIILNIKPGYTVLGNDNFSPELDPGITLERSVFSPAWRTYRALGIPSDSEQADIFRTTLFWILHPVLPTWVISQGYLYLTFFVASISMAALTTHVLKRYIPHKYEQLAFLLGGLFYTCSMLTSWIYFYPLHLFVAAYAFLPLVLWRLGAFIEIQNKKNAALLLVSTCLLSTAALTATMFIVCSMVIILFSLLFFFLTLSSLSLSVDRSSDLIHHNSVEVDPSMHSQTRLVGMTDIKRSTLYPLLSTLFLALFLTFAPHLQWALPFITYVKTNTQALQESAINREITATTIENEAKHNTALNSIRYFASWMDTKEDNATYTFPSRDWYKQSPLATGISIFPALLAIVGTIVIIRRRRTALFILPLTAFMGWYLIKGVNPPLGFVYSFLQENNRVFAQVFRWQSSKLWPLMATTLPLLATIGTLAIVQRVRQNTIYPRPFLKWVSLLFIGTLISGLLIYIYPYFEGGLVRPKVFTQVPPEYAELAQYLKKNDRYGRIYVSPEANTLYFRNYSWGFWGSVVLNYILPNPIIEKALVTGSEENEQAFSVITNAYYSENPDLFINALRLYDVTYILHDGYAQKGTVGYSYNEPLQQNQVLKNKNAKKIWGKGKLALFKINLPIKPDTTIETIDADSDFAKLNTIRLATANTNSYLSSPDAQLSTMYPFAMNFESMTVMENSIEVKKHFEGPGTSYQLSFTSDQLLSSPTDIFYNVTSNTMSLSPSFPALSVNEKIYRPFVPSSTYIFEKKPFFVSVGNTVGDINKTQLYSAELPYAQIKDELVKGWTNTNQVVDLLSSGANGPLFSCGRRDLKSIGVPSDKTVECSSTRFSLAHDSIAQLQLQLKSDGYIRAVVCVWSKLKDGCINTDKVLYAQGETNKGTLFIPTLLSANDTIQISVTLEPQQPLPMTVSLDELKLISYYESIDPIAQPKTTISTIQNQSVNIKKGDLLTFSIPMLSGENTWNLSRSDFIPEINSAPFEKYSDHQSTIAKSGARGISILNKESNSSLNIEIPPIKPQGLMMVALDATHNTGVPIQFSLHEKTNDYSVWKRQAFYKTHTSTIDLFHLPQDTRSYMLEAFTTGLGERASTNTINAIVVQSIPPSWYTMSLKPVSQQALFTGIQLLPHTYKTEANTFSGSVNKGIIAIPEAVSPNWRLDIASSPNQEPQHIRINGWRQGWIVGKEGYAKVIFLPNILVYLGWIPTIVIVGLLGLGWLRKKKKDGSTEKLSIEEDQSEVTQTYVPPSYSATESPKQTE